MNTDATPMQQGMISDATLSDRKSPPESPGEAGWRRLHEHWFEPLFVADWDRAAFLHFSVDPGLLQPWVPFPLDCREDRAWVSLVAFTLSGMRLRAAGRAGRLLCAPIGTHVFLNVRTYVRVGGEPGIHFLAEWLPNRLAVILGPRLFGLPYRLGRLDYRHGRKPGSSISGEVTGAGGGHLHYRAELPADAPFMACEPGTLDEFLLERYTAFVAWQGGRRGFFRVWHRPWPQVRIEPEIADRSLLLECPGGPDWAPGATFALAHFSPGSEEVSMGRPHFL
jgi:uncharacterized protein YqjF (DUF2071 family)